MRIAIVNVGDDISSALIHFFCEKGAEVLGIDEEENIAGLPPGAGSLTIETRLDPQALAEAILQGLQRGRGVEVLVNNFGSSLTGVRMEEGSAWALSAPPQVKAAFAATRAFLTLLRKSRGLIVNLGAGMGPVDQPCPMHYALLGFVHSLGLMGMRNIEAANLCLHNLYGQQPGQCSLCAPDALLTAPGPADGTLCEQVSGLIMEAVDRFTRDSSGTGGERAKKRAGKR